MHWLLLVGGETYSLTGKIVHRACIQHCSADQLKETLDTSFFKIYDVLNGEDCYPPLSLRSYALGFHVPDEEKRIIEDEVLPVMLKRLERRNISQFEGVYKDGSGDLLSREKSLQWIEFLAEQFLSTELVLYEFSDRPEGFLVQQLPEAVQPWKHATVAMFADQVRIEGATIPKTPAENLPLVNQAATASLPQPHNPLLMLAECHDAAAAPLKNDDGAIPSKPAKSAAKTPALSDHDRQKKITLISSALRYNGYPPEVVEDLVKNKLRVWKSTWYLRLPTDSVATGYNHIDENPFPGSKVTGKTERKCPLPSCVRDFAHFGKCAKIDTVRPRIPSSSTAATTATATAANPQGVEAGIAAEGDAPPTRQRRYRLKHTGNSLMEYKVLKIKKALLEAGYSEQMAKKRLDSHRTFRGSFRPGQKVFDWNFLMPGGIWVRSFSEIIKNPKTPEIDDNDVIFSDEENDDGDGNVRAKCFMSEHCIRVQGHVGPCCMHQSYRAPRGKKRKALSGTTTAEEVDYNSESEGDVPMSKNSDGVAPTEMYSILSSSKDEEEYGDSLGFSRLIDVCSSGEKREERKQQQQQQQEEEDSGGKKMKLVQIKEEGC